MAWKESRVQGESGGIIRAGLLPLTGLGVVLPPAAPLLFALKAGTFRFSLNFGCQGRFGPLDGVEDFVGPLSVGIHFVIQFLFFKKNKMKF